VLGIIIAIFAITLQNFTFLVSLSDAAPAYRLEWLDDCFSPYTASSPTFPHIPGEAPLCFSVLCCPCQMEQERREERDWMHVCSSTAICFCRNQQLMGTHWGSLHISLIIKRLRNTANQREMCRG